MLSNHYNLRALKKWLYSMFLLENYSVVIYVLLFSLGACFGSFAGVIISRWPLGISIVSPRSFCTSCQQPLKVWHNIPIVSWLLLRGRCAFCRTSYGLRPLALELVCGLCLTALYIKYGVSVALVERFIFFFLLLCLAYIDMDTFCLPHSLLGILLTIGGISSIIYFMWPELWVGYQEASYLNVLIFGDNSLFSFNDRVLGLLGGFLSFACVNMIATAILRKTKRLEAHQWAMGWGDPILLAGIGLFVGISHLLLVIFLASALGAVVGIMQKMVAKRPALAEDIAEGALPYGPFLALAGIYVYLF